MPNDSTQQPQGKQFTDLLTLGNSGINTFKSSVKIDPAYLSDGENIEIEDGDLSSRLGSAPAFYDASNIPTTSILQIITARDSKGGEYMTRYWNGNFEVWDVKNSKWVNVNGSVTFSDFTKKFGHVSFNQGYGFAWNKGSDNLYLGNGVDQMTKWTIAQGYLTAPLTNGSTIVKLDNAAQFPPIYDAWHSSLSSQPLLIAGTQVAYNAVALGEFISAGQPANGDVWTFTINGTQIVITFVSVIGAAAGNVLIGVNAAATQSNLLGLLQHPGTTSATQVALSSANQTLVGLLTYVSDSTNIYMYQNSSVFPPLTATTVSGASGNNLIATPNALILTSGWGGSTVPIGSIVMMPLQKVYDISGATPEPVDGGNILCVSDQRLYISGFKGQETSLTFSGIIVNGGGIPQPDPEYYTGTVNGINSGGFQEFADGDGPITAVYDSIDNIIVHKRDGIYKFYFQQNASLNAVLPAIAPVYSGPSSGAINNFATITVNQIAYYPTATEGLSTLSPSYSYSGIIYQPAIISMPIQNLATDGLKFSYPSEASYGDNKILWSVAEEGSQIPNLVLYYDVLAQGFGKIRGWYINSMATYGGVVYFADGGGNGIKQTFTSNLDDSGQAYTSFAQTSQMGFGDVAKTKECDTVYVQGTINKGGKLYVDIYYNAINSIWKKTYLIDGDNPQIQFVSDKLFGSNEFALAPFIGYSNSTNDLGLFRFYLKNNSQWAWNTMQIKFYSVDVGTEWVVEVVSVAPVVTESINSDIDLFSVA